MSSRRILLFTTLIVGFMVSPLMGAKIEGPIDARNLVVNNLLQDNLSGKRVLVHPELLNTGTRIQAWHDAPVVTPSEGYVVFIDDMAFASFEHPCRYVFVDKNTGSMQVEGGTTPPRDVQDWLEMETEAFKTLMAAENVRAPRKAQKVTPQRNGRGGELYAVLMNGGASQWSNHVRYWNDLSNIYITLVEVYEYKDENIIVLCSDGLNPAPDQSNGKNSDPDLDGDGDDDIMYSCVYSNVQLVFDQLKDILTEDDQLFVFTTDHGGSAGGWNVYQNLWNSESLYDYQLAGMYDALPQCNIITTMEPCYSGGFEDDLSKPGRVFSSACAYNEVSWAMPPDYVYDTYVFFWTAAVKWEDAYGNAVDADLNSDGLIDMHEAFIFAEEHDFSNETPQYDSNPPDLGDELTLFGSGKVYYVPTDYPTIQDAIVASEGKDTVRVEAGTYYENINFLGKEITVESLDGPQVTVIDGGGSGSVVVFETWETMDSVLRGFTIQNGAFSASTPGMGAGIKCINASPTLLENIITQNGEANYTSGGGVGCMMASPTMMNCVVSNNSASRGGGLYCDSSSPLLYNCTVTDNTATFDGGGLWAGTSADPIATNCIFWGDTPEEIIAGSTLDFTCCDIQGGYSGAGNIDRNPMLASDWDLDRTSPCINMGDNAVASEFDLNGTDRIINGAVDMGACEAQDFILAADAFEMNPRVPTSIHFSLDFGSAFAGRTYILAGTASGIVPGFEVNGTTIPLNWDPYTVVILDNLNTAIFFDFAGTLDGSGSASPVFNWTGGGHVSWVGITLHHAAFTFNFVDMSSNPVPLTFVEEE